MSQLTRGWMVFSADDSSVVFRSPEGQSYIAECVFGNFAHEAEYAFDAVKRMPMSRALLHTVYRHAKWEWPNGRVTRFRISFPERLTRGGATVGSRGLRGFRIITPLDQKIECLFTAREAPIALRAQLRKLFAAPQEENEDAEGKLSHQPVPEGRAAQQEGRQADAVQGRQEPRRKRQGPRRRQPVEAEGHEGLLSPKVDGERAELLREFKQKRMKPPPDRQPKSKAGRTRR